MAVWNNVLSSAMDWADTRLPKNKMAREKTKGDPDFNSFRQHISSIFQQLHQ